MINQIIEFSARNKFVVFVLVGRGPGRRVVDARTCRSTPSPT